MNATLTFTLPDDTEAHALALAGHDLGTALNEIAQHLRNRLKHGDLSDAQRVELERVRDLIPYPLLASLGY